MARKATLEGTQKRLETVRTALYNLERELHFAGITDVEFVRFSPAELTVEGDGSGSDPVVADATVDVPVGEVSL